MSSSSYDQFLTEVLRDHPDGTWHQTSEWLSSKYTSMQIAKMYVKLHQHLVAFTLDEEEQAEADLLRDQMDIFWYATDQQEVEKVLEEYKMTRK